MTNYTANEYRIGDKLFRLVGPLASAAPDSSAGRAFAAVNGAHLNHEGGRLHLCDCTSPLDPVYFVQHDGTRGRMCARCRGVTEYEPDPEVIA